MCPGPIMVRYRYGMSNTVDQSFCEAFIGNTMINDLFFIDNVIIFTELLNVLMVALEALDKKTKALKHQTSRAKTKVNVLV